MSNTVRLHVPARQLDIASTLGSGQVFRWSRQGDAWLGVVGRSVWRVEHGEGTLTVETWGEPACDADVRRFFRLDVDLDWLTGSLGATNPRLAEALVRFAGLRLVCQPVNDALLGFACSSANHVGRIARSLDLLAQHYGAPIAEVEGQTYFALPAWQTLANADANQLWQLADLGYRGKVLRRLGAVVAARPETWLAGLAGLSYLDAHRAIDALPGIGPKIADCVCLYGLGFDEAIPVDSHIWAIARELFGSAIPTLSLTPRTYRAVANLYHDAFGAQAGWAQHYLFHQRRLTPIAERRRTAA